MRNRPRKKKSLLILGILALVLSIWYSVTASQSEYHKTKNTNFTFETIIVNSPDPERLSDFYRNVFRATKVGSDPKWDLENSNRSSITLKTPDYKDQGPLLTIFKGQKENSKLPSANDIGYAHICFEADDIPGLIKQILKNGGKIISSFEDLEKVPAIYGTDPDGTVFEIHLPFPTPFTPLTLYRTLNSLIRIQLKLSPPKTDSIRFLHVNINSKDWERTLSFYTRVLNTTSTGFERNYKGEFIQNLTGIQNAEVKGRHIILPGYSAGGPTFEIFTYNQFSSDSPLNKSDTGRVATGFRVLSLKTAVNKVIQEGGTLISEKENESAILRDIDGNLFLLAQ
ncbi:VOC family protein [Leptospira dzoumogneensis]|uniref:Glyoxalase-like domain protein n=1 Tax=Leptospira dzoumogneensis TaxID=2484904 RepID=A0A4Z1AIP7_9LEPT|nr:VOC family protein [Leptospira dzoumogneensis]TGM98473.1 glyoxalase-like domain protein [Leptospira dzoumogneensis]